METHPAPATEIIGYRILGISDEVNTCDCCGRSNLKATVEILFDDADEPLYYGRTCAARHVHVKVVEIDRGIRAAEVARYEAERAARNAAHAADMAAWDAFLAANAPTTSTDRGDRIAALGGFGPARAAFRATQA